MQHHDRHELRGQAAGLELLPVLVDEQQAVLARALHGACAWNFGNVLPDTTNAFGKTAEYGTPDLARFGGTLTSPVQANPALGSRAAETATSDPPYGP